MDRLFAYIARFAIITIAYAVAIIAASLFLHILVVPAMGFSTQEEQWLALGGLVISVPFLALLIGYFAFVPAALAIVLSELAGWRGFLFHCFAGAAVSIATAVLFRSSSTIVVEGYEAAQVSTVQPVDAQTALVVLASGLVGGIAYWMLAGRTAGLWRNISAD